MDDAWSLDGLEGGLPDALPTSPMPMFRAWFDEGLQAKATPNPDAMALATLGAGGPSSRVVLCRGISVEDGYLVFFTNYQSRKGRELEASGRAAAVFHWDHAQRQARVEGVAVRSPAEESDAYFRRRPLLSRLGAWASEQSRPMASRAELLERTQEVMERFGVTPMHLLGEGEDVEIPRPPHWGGFRLWATSVELWVGGDGRLHDRAVWRREVGDPPHGGGAWEATRLFP
ncbi:MAG: pyridoxamine 5'-phosphate oxidase [Phycisphaerales bacterium]|nr:pyridoxamine 5'-phosphate oxidase [Phycisphaerales bacterium]